MKKLFLSTLAILMTVFATFSQTQWHNPEEVDFDVIQGQGFREEARSSFYNRLPDRAEGMVRKSVWAKSKQTAGESLRFTTDASHITVRYSVPLRQAMNHMPATGVSGVDLYTTNKHGEEVWLAAKRTFGDTIVYKYHSINIEPKPKEHTYTLFLPLYNEVEWLEVGTEEGASFRFERVDCAKPIVAYGTSICQGACASRPGMTWTNILHRRLGREVVNLGFSGDAYLEEEVIGLVGDIDASVYIIDVMPNAYTLDAEPLCDTIVKAVKGLRLKRPDTTILLTDHLGYPHGKAMPEYEAYQKHAHEALAKAFGELQEQGVGNLYHLTYDQLAMPLDGFVEGIHVSDYGMQTYAEAYERVLREILHEPAGMTIATYPAVQQRDSYNWMQRHQQILCQSSGRHFRRVLIGDSIMHFWGGVEDAIVQRGEESWAQFEGASLNMGCGYDRTENVLWRIYHGELDSLTADKITLMIGTNNISFGHPSEDIVAGISLIINAITIRQPEANVILMGIFPRRGREAHIEELNRALSDLATELGVGYSNPGKELLGEDGLIEESLFADGLHPNEAGYMRIAHYFE